MSSRNACRQAARRDRVRPSRRPTRRPSAPVEARAATARRASVFAPLGSCAWLIGSLLGVALAGSLAAAPAMAAEPAIADAAGAEVAAAGAAVTSVIAPAAATSGSLQLAQAGGTEPRELEPRYPAPPPGDPGPYSEEGAGYNAAYIFGMTRSLARSTMVPAAKVPLFVLTVPLDIAFLPFAVIGGFFG